MPARNSVLVVDDDAEVVRWLVESLDDEGYDVTGVTSGEDAIERVRLRKYDLVLSDVEMPGLRGTELLGRLHAVRDTQLVVLMTAFGSIDLAMEAIRLGASDFVAKPFSLDALVHVIKRVLRERKMRREIVRLRAAKTDDREVAVVAKSEAMARAVDLARRAANTDASVLLTGESGVGKGLLARVIHEASARRGRPFVTINCAALPANLVEAELFGVRRGAYTDAREDRDGLFRRAHGGTLFLDEIGEMAIEVQPKLLQAIETGRIRAVGGVDELATNVRVIAATNRPLEEALRERRFRPDLYHRLNVIRIDVPPLRERTEDLPELVDQLLERAAKRAGRSVVGITEEAMRWLRRQAFPGNVRELSNALERAVALTDQDVLDRDDVVGPYRDAAADEWLASAADASLSLDEVERRYIQIVLRRTGGNKTEAARILGVDRRTLSRKGRESDWE